MDLWEEIRKYSNITQESENYFFLFYCGLFVLILVVFVLLLLHYVSAKFHLWPSSGDKLRPRIGILSLVTLSQVNTAFQLKKKKDYYKFGTNPTMEDQIKRMNNWIYKTKRSNLDRLSWPVAQRIEVLSLYGSRWASSEDIISNSYPSRPEVYLVKNVVR